MTADRYRATIDRLNLSQVGAARLFKVDDRTSRRWASGDAPVPEAVAKLLRLMEAGALTVEQVRAA
jgi:DNA-binding transcriptional regulator YiaG